MRPVIIEQETRSFGKPSDWDEALHGSCGVLSIHDRVVAGGLSQMVSKWELEPEDIAAMIKGGALYLTIYGQVHPVVSLHIGVPEEISRPPHFLHEHRHGMTDRPGDHRPDEPDWRGLLAELQSIRRSIDMNTLAAARLTAAVAAIGTGLASLATALKAHPAAQDDSGEINDIAAKLEGFGAELTSIVDDVSGAGTASEAGAASTSDTTGAATDAGSDSGTTETSGTDGSALEQTA